MEEPPPKKSKFVCVGVKNNCRSVRGVNDKIPPESSVHCRRLINDVWLVFYNDAITASINGTLALCALHFPILRTKTPERKESPLEIAA